MGSFAMPRISLWILSLLTLASLAFVACGGDDDDDHDDDSHSRVTTKAPAATINVDLIEFKVTPNRPTVAAGVTKFVANNSSQ